MRIEVVSLPSSKVVDFLGPEEALATHDAAHDRRDATLHDLARRIMALCGMAHMRLDRLDEGREEHAEVAVVPVRRCEVFECDGKVVALSRMAAEVIPGASVGAVIGEVNPLYDLCLVRRLNPAPLRGEGPVPGVPVPLGEVRQHGNFLLPALAQPLGELLVQVHADSSGVRCLSAAGAPVGVAAPPVGRGIWIGSLAGDTVRVIDCVLSGFTSLIGIPLSERLSHLPVENWVRVKSPEDLLALAPGSWLVRWQEDISDLSRPLWFRYDAQTVRPGQFLSPCRISEGNPVADAICCRIGSGVRCQVHRNGDRTGVFFDTCAYDASRRLRQVAEAALAVPGHTHFVLDGELLGDLPATIIRRVLSRRKDLSTAKLRFVAFDCLHLDGVSLHDRSLSERLEALKKLKLSDDALCRADFVDGPPEYGMLARPADSVYALKPEDSDWMVVTDDADNDDASTGDSDAEALADQAEGIASPGPDPDLALSRLWVENPQISPEGESASVRQGDWPVRFTYLRRYVGLVTDDGARSDRVRVLRQPLMDVVERYRAAEFARRGAVLSAALRKPAANDDPSTYLIPLRASGELRIVTPPKETVLLVLTQETVMDALQEALDPERVFEVGNDDFLNPNGNQLWGARQARPLPLDAGAFFGSNERFFEVASGRAVLGVQKPRFHEVFLVFDGTPEKSGRFVWTRIATDDGDRWVGRKPDEQAPYLYTHDQTKVLQEAEAERGWVSWNPEGIRALSRSPLVTLLPLNWESRLEPYDDAPFADFSG